MNRFNADELKALRSAALALNQSDYEITKRLESAFDQISLMIELLHDQSSTETLLKIDNEMDRLIERLKDTKTILHLVLRERELELKLAELDKSDPLPDKELTFKEKIIATLQGGGRIFDDEEGDILAADPETLKKIEQRLQLESLIDTLYGPSSTKVKSILDKVISLEPELSRRITFPRPWRDLGSQVATSKGEAYVPPEQN